MRARCYILYSEKLNRFYTGVTTQTIDERMLKHNQSEYGKHRFTSNANDWALFIIIELEDYAHAVRVERKIKSMKSSAYIKNLKLYPEMIQKLIEQTKSI
jgi:putative endonuclease